MILRGSKRSKEVAHAPPVYNAWAAGRPPLPKFMQKLNGRDELKYRKFGFLDWEASILGLGTARLPEKKRESIELIRYAIDCGVNYLDLGYPYDHKRHERVAGIVREALGDGCRDKIRIAVTLPSHNIRSTADLDAHLSMQLGLLGIDKADFCMFGKLNRENWPALQSLGALPWIEAAIKQGRIDHPGFSFHDHYQPLKSIMASWDRWAVCQFQFSYMDINHDPGIAGIKYAAKRGPAIVVTEPLKGGRLTKWACNLSGIMGRWQPLSGTCVQLLN